MAQDVVVPVGAQHVASLRIVVHLGVGEKEDVRLVVGLDPRNEVPHGFLQHLDTSGVKLALLCGQ